MADFPTYAYIVDQFRTACTEHLAINEFGEGSIDRLDSLTQNVKYPLAFLRPIQSTGMVTNTNGVSGARSLNFEFYMMDVPQLTDTDVLKLQSQTEIYLYDIISYFNLGPASRSQEEFITLNSISPLYEAFNDRVAGWVGNITVNTYGTLDFCNFPKL
jgi:hypothetical protein